MESVSSMKISVHPSLILWISVLFYLDETVLIPFLLAAGLHELGHYFVLRFMKKPPLAIVLSFSGARMETSSLSYSEELIAAAAGPAVSLLLTFVFPLWPALAVYSLILGCFNLLPIPGLDGGRILSCLLLMHLHEDAARRICKYFAIVTALSLWGIALYLTGPMQFGLWPILVAALFLYKALSMDTL